MELINRERCKQYYSEYPVDKLLSEREFYVRRAAGEYVQLLTPASPELRAKALIVLAVLDELLAERRK